MATFEEIFGIPRPHIPKTEFYSNAGGQEEGWTH